jgi:hypothetical protein
MTSRWTSWAWLPVVAALGMHATACNDKHEQETSVDKADDDAKPKKKKKKSDEDDGDQADEMAKAGAGDGAEPAVDKAVGGKSAVPTSAEWNAVTKEVTVRGSSKLNCETKMVREWLRVSCRGKNSSGGEPSGVSVIAGGGRGEDFTFTGAGVASLVVRFVEGVDLKARFNWSDGAHTLHVFWPRGAPEPPPKGEFSPG